FDFCGGIGIRGELGGCLSLLNYGVPHPRSQLCRRWSDGCRRYSLLTDGKLSGGSAVPCDGRPSGSCHLVIAGRYGRGELLYVFPVTCSVFFFFLLQNWRSVFGGRTSGAIHNGGPLIN